MERGPRCATRTGGSCCSVICKWTWCVGMVVMFCFGLNVAGQHFSVVTQLFYIRGIWANVHSKLKLSIKVTPCVLCSCFYSSTQSNMFRLRTPSTVCQADGSGERGSDRLPGGSPWSCCASSPDCWVSAVEECGSAGSHVQLLTHHQTCWVSSRVGLQQDAVRPIIDLHSLLIQTDRLEVPHQYNLDVKLIQLQKSDEKLSLCI